MEDLLSALVSSALPGCCWKKPEPGKEVTITRGRQLVAKLVAAAHRLRAGCI